jgi:hypothetical protein
MNNNRTVQLNQLRGLGVDELREIFYQEVQVSRNQLEKSAFRQAPMFEKWYTLTEEAAAMVRDWEDRLSRTLARADLKIRSMPHNVLFKKHGLEDLKEGAIKSLIQLDPEVKQVKKKIRSLKRKHFVLKGFIISLGHRKSMIRDLENLYCAKYWNKDMGA